MSAPHQIFAQHTHIDAWRSKFEGISPRDNFWRALVAGLKFYGREVGGRFSGFRPHFWSIFDGPTLSRAGVECRQLPRRQKCACRKEDRRGFPNCQGSPRVDAGARRARGNLFRRFWPIFGGFRTHPGPGGEIGGPRSFRCRHARYLGNSETRRDARFESYGVKRMPTPDSMTSDPAQLCGVLVR